MRHELSEAPMLSSCVAWPSTEQPPAEFWQPRPNASALGTWGSVRRRPETRGLAAKPTDAGSPSASRPRAHRAARADRQLRAVDGERIRRGGSVVPLHCGRQNGSRVARSSAQGAASVAVPPRTIGRASRRATAPARASHLSRDSSARAGETRQHGATIGPAQREGAGCSGRVSPAGVGRGREPVPSENPDPTEIIAVCEGQSQAPWLC